MEIDQGPSFEPEDPKATGGTPTKFSRRSHKKSRNGCINCKRRKVKCDEAKPSCYNCKRFAVRCQFPLPEPKSSTIYASSTAAGSSAAGTSDGLLNPDGAPQKRPRGRPRKNWATLDLQQPGLSHHDAPPSARTPSMEPSSFGGPSVSDDHSFESGLGPVHVGDSEPCVNTVEAELLHHYMSSTSLTLGGSHGLVVVFWWTGAVRIGLTYPFVLHLIYALSARHLAYLHPERRDYFLPLAVRNNAAGLAQMSALLPSLNDENGYALYIAAILVCFNTFATGPTSLNDLLFIQDGDDEAGPVQWMMLVHGIRSITESTDHKISFTTLLKQVAQTEKLTLPPPMATETSTPQTSESSSAQQPQHMWVDWEEPVELFRSFLVAATTDDIPGAVICLNELDRMIPNFEARFGRKSGASSAHDLNTLVLRWVYTMRDAFLQCLQEKNPLALLVLGYFTVLMVIAEAELWCLEGWVDHILRGVCDRVADEYMGWLEWPKQAVQL